MIQKFNGYEEAKKNAQVKKSEQLPVGAYVCEILRVKQENGYLKLQFDVAEGEYKDFFQKQYKENTDENKKYKGITTIWLPKEDGTQQDSWTKDKFAKWTTALEDSNEGYFWDWDETKWQGKKVGILYGEVGKNIEGKDVKYNECRYPCSVDYARSGKAKAPKFFAYKGYNESKAPESSKPADFMNIPDDISEEIPF